MRSGSLVAVPLALLFAGAAAGQQPSADDLFREGTLLFGRGETKAACERFAASYKIDIAPGTLFNLAACHEKDGHLAQARAEFQEFADRAIKAGKADKAQPAVERAAAIEARMPKLVLSFPPGSNVQTILVDGVARDASEWQKPLPVEAGSHAVELRAPGKVSATKTVTLAGEGASVTVDVPLLAPEGGTVTAAPPPIAPPPVAPLETKISQTSSSGSKRTAGLVVGGGGIVALGVGTAFGIITLSQKSTANADCEPPSGSGTACKSGKAVAANNELDTARTSSWVSTIGLGVGVVAVGVGAYLFFTGGTRSEESAPASTGLRVVPSLGRDGGGLSLAGAF
jgi:hypothetical protein